MWNSISILLYPRLESSSAKTIKPVGLFPCFITPLFLTDWLIESVLFQQSRPSTLWYWINPCPRLLGKSHQNIPPLQLLYSVHHSHPYLSPLCSSQWSHYCQFILNRSNSLHWSAKCGTQPSHPIRINHYPSFHQLRHTPIVNRHISYTLLSSSHASVAQPTPTQSSSSPRKNQRTPRNYPWPKRI